MSAEITEVRPFDPVESLDQLLKDMEVRFGDSTIACDGWTFVSEESFLRSPVVLRLAGESDLRHSLVAVEEELETSPYCMTDLTLVVVLSSAFLKQAEVTLRVPLLELSHFGGMIELSGPPRPRVFRSPNAGCQIDVNVCLSRELPRKPLQAWRAWTWISRASFRVKSERSFTNFTPRPLTDVDRDRLGLPRGAFRYVTMADASPLEVGTNGESLELWVDADALATMAASNTSMSSVILQRQLFVDAISAVVRAASADPSLRSVTIQDLEETLLGSVLRLVAGANATSEALSLHLDMVIVDPALFLARVEDIVGMLGSVGDLFGGQR